MKKNRNRKLYKLNGIDVYENDVQPEARQFFLDNRKAWEKQRSSPEFRLQRLNDLLDDLALSFTSDRISEKEMRQKAVEYFAHTGQLHIPIIIENILRIKSEYKNKQ